MPGRQVAVGPFLIAEGILAREVDVDIFAVTQAQSGITCRGIVQVNFDAGAALLIPTESICTRADHQVVKDYADLGKCLYEKGDQVGVGRAGIEPQDVVFFSCVPPDRVGLEGAYIYRGKRVEWTANLVKSKADDIAALGQPVHVVQLRGDIVRYQSDAQKVAGMGF